MSKDVRPTFAELSHDDAIELLGRNHIGRLAFTFHDRVDIEPISYVYDEGWVYARTSPGTKLTTVHHHPWVAFEVDEIRSRNEWKSVVVRGTIYFLDSATPGHERAEYEAALERLRSADPTALTDEDLAPHRRALFRIHADEITGRRASPR
ncbi:MAG TPA: pyridoxamine 5'-phosphate oxidase family protein [Gemmatimonadaceae bacterium]|nr:pyridoxamine 5'-phosphate oxidase family protein [Gemmatimonadaceae bacterium]